jgi:hypothetical protein
VVGDGNALNPALNGQIDDLLGIGHAVERIFAVDMQVALDHI